jgi:hypothetical protein
MRTSRVQLEHLIANTFVATVQGSIPAPSINTVEVEGRYTVDETVLLQKAEGGKIGYGFIEKEKAQEELGWF